MSGETGGGGQILQGTQTTQQTWKVYQTVKLNFKPLGSLTYVTYLHYNLPRFRVVMIHCISLLLFCKCPNLIILATFTVIFTVLIVAPGLNESHFASLLTSSMRAWEFYFYFIYLASNAENNFFLSAAQVKGLNVFNNLLKSLLLNLSACKRPSNSES